MSTVTAKPRLSRIDVLLGVVAIAVVAIAVVAALSLRDRVTGADAAAAPALAAAPAPDGWQLLPGGMVRVAEVNTSTLQQMQGMPAPDAAPPGFRRFALRLDLAAASGEGGLRIGEGIRVSGSGIDAPVAPLHAVPTTLDVPAGMQGEVLVVFQVPKSASAMSLDLPGLKAPIALAVGDAVETSHGHGSSAPTTDDGATR